MNDAVQAVELDLCFFEICLKDAIAEVGKERFAYSLLSDDFLAIITPLAA